MNSIFEYSDLLFQKTENWKKEGGFKHKKPCKDWLAGRNCSHYAKARYKHFKEEIDSVLQVICNPANSLRRKAHSKYPPTKVGGFKENQDKS